MDLKQARLRDEFGNGRELSEVEEYVVDYLLRYARIDEVRDHLHLLDYQFYQAVGEKSEQDADRLFILLENLEAGHYVIEESWMDTLFAYVMKINRFHNSE